MTDPAVRPAGGEQGSTARAGSVRPAAPAPDGSVVVPARTGVTVAAPSRPPEERLSSWALAVSMFAIVLSWFAVWALPLGMAGVALAAIALARGRGRRDFAWWGLGLGLGAIVCSAFWIVWALTAVAPAAKGA